MGAVRLAVLKPVNYIFSVILLSILLFACVVRCVRRQRQINK